MKIEKSVELKNFMTYLMNSGWASDLEGYNFDEIIDEYERQKK